MTTIDTSITRIVTVPNHQPTPLAPVPERAERRCSDRCRHRLGLGSPWTAETVIWASPRLRPLGRSIVDGPPVSELFRHCVPKPRWMTHQNAEVRKQFDAWMDGLTRLGYTHRAMARVDTPTPLDHARYRPLPEATLARIRAGIRRYGDIVTGPRGDGYPGVQPPRCPDLYSVVLAALSDGFERDRN